LSGKAPTLVQHSKPLPSGPQEAGHTGNSIRSVVSSRSVCDSDSMREAVGTTLLLFLLLLLLLLSLTLTSTEEEEEDASSLL